MLRAPCLLLGLALSAFATAAPAPVINLSVQYYPVTGSTTDEINQSIFSVSPILIRGTRYGAVTKNEFQTGYSRVATEKGGCEVRNVRVVLNSTILLPQLTQGYHSPAVMNEWRRYMAALIAHEQLHALNGKHTAQTLASRLFGFKSDLPCDEMGERLNAAIDKLIDNMGEWDRELDSTTHHGHTQGAFLQNGIR